MIDRGFEDVVAPIAEGLSGDQIHFAVQTLDDTAGEGLPGLEPVDDQIFMATDCANELLQRFQLRGLRPLVGRSA